MPSTAAQSRVHAGAKGGDDFDALVATAPERAPERLADDAAEADTPASALDRRLRLLEGSLSGRRAVDRDGHAVPGRKHRRNDDDEQPAEPASSGVVAVPPAPDGPNMPVSLSPESGGDPAGGASVTEVIRSGEPDSAAPQLDLDAPEQPTAATHKPAKTDAQANDMVKPATMDTAPAAIAARDDDRTASADPERGTVARKPGGDRTGEEGAARPAPAGAPSASGQNTPSTSAPILATATSGTIVRADAARTVAETVAASTQSVTHRDGVTTRTLEIRLDPGGSAPVTATLKLEGSQLTIEIAAPTAEAHRHLTGETDRIAASLRALGYDVQSVTVLQPSIASPPPSSTHASAGGGTQTGAGPAFEDRGGSGGRQGSGTPGGNGGDGERRDHANAQRDHRGIYI
jgi:chemotaxis protein MotD